MRIRFALLPLLLAAGWSPPLPGATAPALPSTHVEVWVRGPGGARQNPRRIELDRLPLEEVERVDLQYGRALRYRGVPLARLLATYAPPEGVDLAILHFANRMAVPAPFRDAKAMKRLDLFVARAVLGEGGATGEFPPVARKAEGAVEVKPIVPAGNKLVVADRWHPQVPEKARAVFTPWQEVDSLVGIELVRADAWFNQFDVDPAVETHGGWELYLQSCQFCHGVRKVGAGYGWDFVEPVPASTVRKTDGKLFFHVRYRAASEQQRGVLMPGLQQITEADARMLHAWLRAVAARPLADYTP